jgi:hypothetical protein
LLRRRAAFALAGLALACANVEPPPGGPPDTAPPQIVAVRPESGAVVRDLRGDAEIRFDEVVDEMASGTPGSGLERFVVLSPVAGRVRVSWARTAIRARPREGWKPGRVYRLELRPGLLDLRRNVLKEGRVILFSTGPAIPNGVLSGTVVQWVEQRLAPDALIQAALLPDTAPYVTFADSSGRFRLDGLPAGRYAVYAVVDANRNGLRDRREPYDSAIVTLDSSAAAVLWTFVHDTAGPRLRTADHVDSLSARLTFSQALDPALRFDSTSVQVVTLPDSTPVTVRRILTPAQFDSLLARERAADSARRAAADTAAPRAAPARPDSAVRPAGPPRPLVRGATPPPTAEGDTTALRALLRGRPLPTDRVMLRLAAPFAPGGKYLIRVRGARNLNGAVADGQAVLSIPVPAAPRAPADSTPRP